MPTKQMTAAAAAATTTKQTLTRIAVGAASPTAQGHAITITASENMKEKSAGPAPKAG